MTSEQKVLFADRVNDLMQQYVTSEDMPVMIGTLNTAQGINGFVLAEIGHPVFEYKDRYIIYMESKTPDRITVFGQPVVYKDLKVAIPYYKEMLLPLINRN